MHNKAFYLELPAEPKEKLLELNSIREQVLEK